MKAKRDEDKPKPAKVKKDLMSNASSLLKQEFAEDSREDEEDSDQVSDEEEKKRKWEENLYYYKCPVFRVSNQN